jgi:hypothetical protein
VGASPGGRRARREALLGATLNFLERSVDKFIHQVLIMACNITNERLANCTNLLKSRATTAATRTTGMGADV